MSRQATHKLFLTMDEHLWVVRTIQRVAERASKLADDAAGITKTERVAIAKFNEKIAQLPLPDPKTGLFELNSNRIELRILQKIARNEHAALLAEIIPGYMDRAEKDAARYRPYLEKSQARAQMLVELQNKIKRKL